MKSRTMGECVPLGEVTELSLAIVSMLTRLIR